MAYTTNYWICLKTIEYNISQNFDDWPYMKISCIYDKFIILRGLVLSSFNFLLNWIKKGSDLKTDSGN